MRYFLMISLMTLTLLSACDNRRGKGATNQTASIKVIPPVLPTTRPTINVYIENSGSMNGYVKGVTEFEQSVYNYLSDIKISQITDTLNLYYINSEKISIAQNADADVIKDFIDKLEPSTFKAKGGKLGVSDISDVIKSVLLETKQDCISILITDGIFSPGKGKSADEYLINQQIGIKTNVAEYLNQHNNTGVIIYQLSSKFEGLYYNKEDKPISINEQRPFYICLIGNAEQLTKLRGKVPESKFKGSGIQNIFSIMRSNKTANYAIKNGSGNFKLNFKNPKTTIENWKKDSKGHNSNIARFSVNADLSSFLLDDSYLTNTENYQLSENNFKLSISKAVANTFGYTQSLNISSDHVKKGVITIKLKTTVPQWVEYVNDDNGSSCVAGKTYGIKYIINGIYEAYAHDNHNYYTEIKVNIN